MLLSVVYAMFRVLVDALVSGKHRNRELEILVLRHQLSMLQRSATLVRWHRQLVRPQVGGVRTQWSPRPAPGLVGDAGTHC